MARLFIPPIIRVFPSDVPVTSMPRSLFLYVVRMFSRGLPQFGGVLFKLLKKTDVLLIC